MFLFVNLRVSVGGGSLDSMRPAELEMHVLPGTGRFVNERAQACSFN